MNLRNQKFLLAPVGVATGLTLLIVVFEHITTKLGLSKLTSSLTTIPHWMIFPIGVVLIAVWGPIFIAGFYSLSLRNAMGQSGPLIVTGIYKYVRNPMYSGLSLTVIGLGFLLNRAGLLLAGFIWFLIVLIQCFWEQKQLHRKFGERYLQYKRKTPMFIPDFGRVVQDLFKSR